MPPSQADMRKWFEKAEGLRQAASPRPVRDPSISSQLATFEPLPPAEPMQSADSGLRERPPWSGGSALGWGVAPAHSAGSSHPLGIGMASARSGRDGGLPIPNLVSPSAETLDGGNGTNGGCTQDIPSATASGELALEVSELSPIIKHDSAASKRVEVPRMKSNSVQFSSRPSHDGKDKDELASPSGRSWGKATGGAAGEEDDDVHDVSAHGPWYADLVEGVRLIRKHAEKGYADLTFAKVWRFVLDRVPVLEWLPKYTMEKFFKDLQAGLVVGCMLIPQGMGYADVAGLPFVAGLYSGFAPLLVYFLTGTSRQMGIGPVAIVSLLVAEGVPVCNKLCPGDGGVLLPEPWPSCSMECQGNVDKEYNPEYWSYATCIALMSGIIHVACAPLLGFVMNFVPHPVISGFTSAGGLIIAMSQLKDIVGFQVRKGTLQNGIVDFFSNIDQTHGITCVMGSTAIIWLFTMRKLGQGKLWFAPSQPVPPRARLFGKLPWPFLTVIIYIIVSSQVGLDQRGVKITGAVPDGLPQFVFPKNFFANIPALLPITIQIVIIGFLESIAVETNFATKLKYQVRPTQEAVAQGAANIIGGLTMCYPVVGSFSRSAANASYDSQSPMCNLITGCVIMLTLLFLTKLFYYMPLNVLAAIVIVAALSLVDPHEAIFLWSSSKKEFCLLLLTFTLTAFAKLELGIYVSIALCAAEVGLPLSLSPSLALFSSLSLSHCVCVCVCVCLSSLALSLSLAL